MSKGKPTVPDGEEVGPLLTSIVIERRLAKDGSDVLVGVDISDGTEDGLPELVIVLGMLELAKDTALQQYAEAEDDTDD